MAQKRDNCIIILVDPPEPEKLSPELKAAFGPERAAHVNSDLVTGAYKLAKAFPDAILLLSYEKTPHHPDLTWLDQEDPGFLEVKALPRETRLREAFRLAFFTGAKKAIYLNHLSPEIKKDWLYQAFDSANEKTVALGPNQDGSFCLLGLTQANLKLLETPGFLQGKNCESMAERAKKTKLAVFNTPETYSINGEEDVLRWMESLAPSSNPFKTEERPAQETQAAREHKRSTRHHHKETPVPPPAPEKPPL